ncbi:hypothetical protein THAOC_03637, partial [Thalassiosira oceanica]
TRKPWGQPNMMLSDLWLSGGGVRGSGISRRTSPLATLARGRTPCVSSTGRVGWSFGQETRRGPRTTPERRAGPRAGVSKDGSSRDFRRPFAAATSRTRMREAATAYRREEEPGVGRPFATAHFADAGEGVQCPARRPGRGIPPPSVSERSTPGSSPGEDRGAPPCEGGGSARPPPGGRHGGGVKPRPRAAVAGRRSRGRTTDGAPEGGTKGGRRTGRLRGRGSVRPYEKEHGKVVSEHHLGLGFRKCDNQHDRKHPKFAQPESSGVEEGTKRRGERPRTDETHASSPDLLGTDGVGIGRGRGEEPEGGTKLTGRGRTLVRRATPLESAASCRGGVQKDPSPPRRRRGRY